MTGRRAISILAGYAAASAVAGFALVITLVAISSTHSPLIVDLPFLRITFMLTSFVACLVAGLALLPFLGVMAYAERHSITSRRWYAVAGAVAGVAAVGIYLMVALARERASVAISVDLVVLAGFSALALAAVLAGALAGYTFWLIAGRRTGGQ